MQLSNCGALQLMRFVTKNHSSFKIFVLVCSKYLHTHRGDTRDHSKSSYSHQDDTRDAIIHGKHPNQVWKTLAHPVLRRWRGGHIFLIYNPSSAPSLRGIQGNSVVGRGREAGAGESSLHHPQTDRQI